MTARAEHIHDPASVIRKNLNRWETPYVELDIFGTGSAGRIAEIVDAFCRKHLGSRLAGYLFQTSSAGSTHGVHLEDGRDVVIKARPPVQANPDMKHDLASLETVFRVTQWLHARAYPCPRPILGPAPLAGGIATVDEYLVRGERGDGFQPGRRRAIAEGLAELIKLLRSCDVPASRLSPCVLCSGLYPQPHGRIFNFEATAAGAEWIDDFARRARRLEARGDFPVLAHSDWRVEHLRFLDGRIAAVYDWDSLSLRPETEQVGISSHGFTADWSLSGVRRIPSARDIREYVADYEQARGRNFTRRERRSVFATSVFWIAYGARCMHSLEPLKAEWEENTFPYLLRTEGEALLADAQ